MEAFMHASASAARLPITGGFETHYGGSEESSEKSGAEAVRPQDETLPHGADSARRASSQVPVLRQDLGGGMQSLHGVVVHRVGFASRLPGPRSSTGLGRRDATPTRCTTPPSSRPTTHIN